MSTPSVPAEFWNARYAEPGFAYGDAPNDFVVETAGAIRSGARVLCLAEGEGRNAVWLAARGADVLAVDLSEVGLTKAAELAATRGVRIATQVADLAHWVPSPASFDAIVSIWAHMPVAVRATLHQRCVEALRPGGVFVLEAYTPAQLALATGGPRDAALLMSADALRGELAGLEFETVEEIERDVHEGPWHDGRSAVVRVLARKPA